MLESFAESAWTELTNGSVDEPKWIRGIAGQFLEGHLTKALVGQLGVFYDAISAVHNNPNTSTRSRPSTHSRNSSTTPATGDRLLSTPTSTLS
jgi:hypothetical protein